MSRYKKIFDGSMENQNAKKLHLEFLKYIKENDLVKKEDYFSFGFLGYSREYQDGIFTEKYFEDLKDMVNWDRKKLEDEKKKFMKN